ncbi:MAG: hypothetical protein Tsb009_13630 [Planctomycetaceae bacterium]
MSPKKKKLTLANLRKEARLFAEMESVHPEKALFGVTDGKAVGTYFEHKFQAFLHSKYRYDEGNSARGIDFPELGVDMKVTSIKQPQSSSPFKSARQKVYGLGYSLLVFVYEKMDDSKSRTGLLKVLHTIFIEAERTADYQTTRGIRQILDHDGNQDDLIAYFSERNLPLDDIQADNLAAEVLKNPPVQGYLTISNALQWRLQYGRVIQEAGQVTGYIE